MSRTFRSNSGLRCNGASDFVLKGSPGLGARVYGLGLRAYPEDPKLHPKP